MRSLYLLKILHKKILLISIRNNGIISHLLIKLYIFGVYQMDGMRDVSVNALPIDLIIHCWQVQLKQLFKVIFLLCLFLVVLGLPCCTWAFSSCGEWGLLFVAVYQLLIAVASLVSEHGL